MFQRPLVDIACVSVHDQVTQRAVVWCGEMEFTVGFEDVGAAWEAEESIDTGREGDVCGRFVVVCGDAWGWVGGCCSGEVGKANEVLVALADREVLRAGAAVPLGGEGVWDCGFLVLGACWKRLLFTMGGFGVKLDLHACFGEVRFE